MKFTMQFFEDTKAYACQLTIEKKGYFTHPQKKHGTFKEPFQNHLPFQ